jgi:outer membrane protein TolC
LNRESAVARETLNRVMGVYGAQTNYVLEARPLLLPEPLIDANGLENKAITTRLDMKAALKSVDYTARDAGYTENTRLLQEVELSASSEKTTDSDRLNTFGVKIPLPIFDFGQGRVSKTQAIYNQSVHHLYETAVNIRSQVREAYAASRYAYDKAYEATTVIVTANAQILEETKLFYNGMLDGIYELLEDQRRFGEAKMQSLVLMGEYHKAKADLEYAVGGDSNGTK